jgi:hypothetical protein
MKNLENIPKKKRPAFAGRRSGDAIPGGAKTGLQNRFILASLKLQRTP